MHHMNKATSWRREFNLACIKQERNPINEGLVFGGEHSRVRNYENPHVLPNLTIPTIGSWPIRGLFLDGNHNYYGCYSWVYWVCN